MATAFIHCYQVNHWQDVLRELLGLTKPVGFERVRLSVVGIELAMEVLPPADLVPPLMVVARCPSGDELGTLRDLWRYARASSNDEKLFYCHCKGVTHPEIRQLEDDWWRMMAYFLLEQHEKATAWLDRGATCVGVNFTDYPKKHFSGNFWWARAAYVRTLDEPVAMPEEWICSGKSAQIIGLYRSGVNHYFHRYPRERYAMVEQPT